jgi:tRNA threonylcarbamoyl adenosine modification protein YeaZ
VSDKIVLAFDTSAAHCAAALLLKGQVLTKSEIMGRGQAERLMPLIQELLDENDLAFSDLDRIGVGIGPGNFTGIRISVSAARGLALSLGVPAIGVSGLTALRAGQADATAAIVGPRETAYLQIGEAAPQIVTADQVPSDAVWLDDPDVLVASLARLTACSEPGMPPAPLYLRAADATPTKDAAPVILE